MTRDFRFYDLSDDHFESVIVHVCREVLGTGTVKFAKGPDGGRDGRFEGTAQKYPSTAAPWSGKFIIQSKHTSNPIASCSDAEFETNESGVLRGELPRIKALKKKREVDNYLLFTNRKVTGNADARIRKTIVNETGVAQAALLGVETISDWIQEESKLIKICKLDQLLGPLRFHAQDLKEVIEAFFKQKTVSKAASKGRYKFSYRSVEEKNEKNQLGHSFFEFMKSNSEAYFAQIRKFLTNPANAALTEHYHNIADEFNNKIAISRDQFGAFEAVFSVLYDTLLDDFPELKARRRLINVFLHFMYFSCDLGVK